MAFKFVVLCALLSAANAGLAPVAYSAPLAHYAVANPSLDAVGSTQHNVVRSYAGTVSQYSKAVDTPYSSVRKSDTRINNNVYTPTYAKALTYAAPQAVYSHAAPAAAVYSQHVAPAAVYSHATPTVYSHAAPAAVIAQPAAHAIAYSPAATVAHVTFDGFGAHYGY
ncbi:cuticle protein 76-like [Episyrphus balteatus]|uniref:cuticle protein 76-like n=1 Tax=Episyrphus balteatus TaxID=286459 RepID=UPI002486BB33|nr:cuticle protein 76-like [Episyrphus balteatus]